MNLFILINGDLAVTDKDKADALNLHFSNVFTKEDFVNTPVMNDIHSGVSISDIPIHHEAIYNKLCQLDISKSPGPDEWHPRFSKESAEQLVIIIIIKNFV